MKKIFVLASGRSGTRFLSELFKHNIKNCISKHEPKPDMFGKSIYHYNKKSFDLIEKEFNKKKQTINNLDTDVYIETNHAFLKSFSDIAIKSYPDMKVIHLIRNPLKVARSELNRHRFLDKIHFPFFRYYTINDKNYFRWSLTGEEEIFTYFKGITLSPYQKYIVQWIEIENRAMKFLDKYNMYQNCFTMFVPVDFKDLDKINELFKFLDLKLKHDKPIIKGKKNRIPLIKTVITEKDKEEFQEVIKRLPNKYLEIFRKPPYTKAKWINIFYEVIQ